MSHSTVPHTEISLRLTILNEFLFDEQKPIEELYGSWMRRVGGRIMEYTEFEYWYRRFHNNQFDLGYDNSQDEDAVSEIQKKTDPEGRGVKDQIELVERKMKNLEEDRLFDEKHVPIVFRRMNSLKKIDIHFHKEYCTLKLDDSEIRFEKDENGWMIHYKKIGETIKTDDPEKSIIDHLWFELKNPNLNLEHFGMEIDSATTLDSEKLSSILKSMFDSIDHQIHTVDLWIMGFDVDTFLSVLKKFRPGKLLLLVFTLSWKGKGNYHKLDEIVECDQWKEAKRILSPKESPLKIEDFLHCNLSLTTYDNITPELVLRIYKLFSNSKRSLCNMFCNKNNLDIDAIMDVIRNDGAEVIGSSPTFHLAPFRYKIINKAYKFSCVYLYGNSSYITIDS